MTYVQGCIATILDAMEAHRLPSRRARSLLRGGAGMQQNSLSVQCGWVENCITIEENPPQSPR